MQQGWLGQWMMAACLLAPTPTVLAQAQWTLVPPNAKHALPAHLSGFAQLPPGCLIALQRDVAKSYGPWTLNLPDGAALQIERGSVQHHANGDVSYAGTVAGFGAAYTVFLTEGREASFGYWITPRGRFRFEAWGDRGWLIDLDHPQLSEPSRHDDAIAPEPARASQTSATSKSIGDTKAAAGTQIDALFIYPPAFAERYPGSATQTRVQHLAALANQIFANSDVDLGIRVVAVEATSYDPPDNAVALDAMRAALQGAGTPAPGLGQLRARRDAVGADLVTLIRPHDIEVRGNCGIAFFPGRGPDFGVNVLSDGSSSWSICSDEVYAHEVGHNLGAEHQLGASSANAGFGRAHVVLGQFHTVMGSFGTGSPDRGLRLLRFSNSRQQCGGSPCGVFNSSDNSRRLLANMAEIAGYRSSRSSLPAAQAPAALDPDQDGDGVPESIDAFPHDPAHSSDLDRDGVADGLDAFPGNAAESADTDGDGSGDNVDPDIDGDGVPNSADALPHDASEVSDLDADGVGDNADAFASDRREWGDVDGDGIGDNADPDSDGDGLDDFDDVAQDLLVSSLGTDRVIRLDGDSGRFVAVEIAESYAPVAVGPKSALAWNPYRRRVDALIASGVRRYDPALRRREAQVLRSSRSDDAPGLRSGLSAAMTVATSGAIVVADGSATTNNSLHRFDPVSAREAPLGSFSDAAFFAALPRALLATGNDSVWALDRDGGLKEVSVGTGSVARLLNAKPAGETIDATATAIGPDAAVYVADVSAHRVLRVDPNSGVVTTHVAGGSAGLNQPLGLAFDRAGRLYVSSAGTHQVLRYDGASGAFIDVFSKTPVGALSRPQALLFVPQVSDRYARDSQQRWRPRAGAWHDPQRPGQGLDIQAIPGGLAIGWYTYDPQGRATWYLGVGALQSDRWSAPLQRYVWNGSTATATDVGSAELEFVAENRANFHWTLGTDGGSESIEQLETAQVVESQFPTADWYAPDTPGWGYSITRLGDLTALAAFYFDTQGQPTWSLGVAEAGAESFAMRRYSDADGCPACDGTAPTQSREIGTVRFNLVDGVHARGDIDLQDADIDWQYDELELQRLTDSPTQPNGDPLP